VVERAPRETLVTDTGAVVVVSDTTRVRPTLDISTSVNAPVLSLDRLTDLIVATVKVVGTG
jgi:hypothetical protein